MAYWRPYLLLLLFIVVQDVMAGGCPSPPSPLNCQVTQTDAEAVYKCDPGYTLFGSSTLNCENDRWSSGSLPICATNIAYNKPVNQSTTTTIPERGNDGLTTFLHEGDRCATTQKQESPFWILNLLSPVEVAVVTVATRACCDIPALQNLEVRVGNHTEIQKNRLCAWVPGVVEEGVVKELRCALPIIGQYVAIQMPGVDAVLSLCEVQVFSTQEIARERCSTDVQNIGVFNRTCFQYNTKIGSSFDQAREKCKQIDSTSTTSDLVYGINDVTHMFLTSELTRRTEDVKGDLVWIGVRRDTTLLSSSWKWVDGSPVNQHRWGRQQPNNYNGKQNCVALDKGQKWSWNDVGCELDYLPSICRFDARECGSPDKLVNTTYTKQVKDGVLTAIYKCPTDSALVGDMFRTCLRGVWQGQPPSCKYVNCGPPDEIENGNYTYIGTHRNTYSAKITYTCALNYSLEGVHERMCTSEGVWSSPKPTCVYNSCKELLPPAHGGVTPTTGSRAGDVATYYCDVGFLLVGAETVSCELGGDWSDIAPMCKYIDCGIPNNILNGKVELVNSTTILDSHVHYSCQKNYYLEGSEKRICGQDGAWSPKEPVCQLVTCPKPEIGEGSFVTGYSLEVNAKVKYECDEGHRMVIINNNNNNENNNNKEEEEEEVIMEGIYYRTCLESGNWNGSMPLCIYTDCGVVEGLPEGSVSYANGSTFYNSLLRYECDTNHKLVGNLYRTCQQNGMWSGEPPSCIEIRCPPPPLQEVGSKTSAILESISRTDGRLPTQYGRRGRLPSVNQSFKVGSVATYSCPEGYVINATTAATTTTTTATTTIITATTTTTTLTCSSNGTWSDGLPSCSFVDCGMPERIEKGHFRLLRNSTHFGSQVSYQCSTGYKLNGRIRRHCTANGTWSGENPVCDEILCPNLASVATEAIAVLPTGTKIGSVANYSCPIGRKIVGKSLRTCLSSGFWSGNSPRCEWVSCNQPQEIENGRLVRLNSTLTFGSLVEYHCLPNSTLKGPFIRTCESDGQWSLPETFCLADGDAALQGVEGSAGNTGVYIGLFFGLLLAALFLATLIYMRKRRGSRETKTAAAAGVGVGGGVSIPPPLPPPNETKDAIVSYSSLTDPITGNNIYENIDGEVGEDYNNYNNNNNSSSRHTTATTATTTTTTTTTTTAAATTAGINRGRSSSRRPRLPPPQPPTIPATTATTTTTPSTTTTTSPVTINGFSINV